MKNESEIQINANALCVLKLVPNSKLVMVSYEQVDKQLDNDFEQLKLQFNLDYKDAKCILQYVKSHDKLKILLGKYDYCQILNKSYQGLKLDIGSIESKYPSNFLNHPTSEILKKKEDCCLICKRDYKPITLNKPTKFVRNRDCKKQF